jgi:hypothetical protein
MTGTVDSLTRQIVARQVAERYPAGVTRRP